MFVQQKNVCTQQKFIYFKHERFNYLLFVCFVMGIKSTSMCLMKHFTFSSWSETRANNKQTKDLRHKRYQCQQSKDSSNKHFISYMHFFSNKKYFDTRGIGFIYLVSLESTANHNLFAAATSHN